MRNRCVPDLVALLVAENAAIVAGQYERLDDLAGTKLALFAALPSAHPTRSEMQQIVDLLQQNQILMGAAIKGIVAARDRFLALRDVREGLQVYDRSGQFITNNVDRPGLVKKA